MSLLYLLAQFNSDNVNIPKAGAGESQIQDVLRLVFIIAGAISVLVIAIAGLNYVLSSGDPQKVAKAKDTILYAVIGLVISIMATVVVTFMLGRLF